MKNLKTHHHLAIVSMLIFGVVGVWTWGAVVLAGTSGTTIQMWVGPAPDNCPNIPGYQTEVPEGMLVDGDGNCYTPPPQPVDMCNNIDGVQETIPDGYYQDGNGACQLQPTPPTPPNDVCPNITGVQATVPDGYENTADGRCVRPPADMCNNITGSQLLVPDDMERTENGVCFTPSAAVTTPPSGTGSEPVPEPVAEPNPWVEPVEPRAPAVVNGSADLKNVPSAFEGLILPLVAAIPDTIKDALRSVPPIVAQTFPYFTFFVLILAAIIMSAQTVSEIAAIRKITRLTKREQEIAEEKDSFIALASHYLRTPLTLMQGALDTSRATNELPAEAMEPLRSELRVLDGEISAILNKVDSNTALTSITAPEKETLGHTTFLTSAFFWVPIVATILIALIANFLLGVVGDVELGVFNLLGQAGVYIATSLLFYSAIRTRFLRRQEREYRLKLLRHEEIIDTARNDFISSSTLALSAALQNISSKRSILTDMKSEPYFNDGFERFNHLLQKFTLLGEIQAGVVGATEKFDIKTAIDNVAAHYQPQLAAKNLTIVTNITATSVTQRRSLFDFVLGSLIDNAIKFSNEGGTITISATPHERTLTVQVSDYGPSIPKEKMSQLFKPFTRGSSSMEFNYEGLGFSLFLDKIIMDYVGGAINVNSVDHKNTTFSVTTPLS